MDAAFWIAVGFLVLLPGAQRDAIKIWRGTQPAYFAFLSERRMRSMPLAITLGWPVIGLAIVMTLLPIDSGFALLAAGLWAATTPAAVVLIPAVHYLGKPQRLVPPWLREECG